MPKFGQSLEAKRSEALSRIAQAVDDQERAITGIVAGCIKRSWAQKEAAARAYRKDHKSIGPDEMTLLEQEAQLRGKGETVPQLVAKIINNANEYRKALVSLDAAQSKALDTITSAKDVKTITEALESAFEDISRVGASGKSNEKS